MRGGPGRTQTSHARVQHAEYAHVQQYGQQERYEERPGRRVQHVRRRLVENAAVSPSPRLFYVRVAEVVPTCERSVGWWGGGRGGGGEMSW